MSFDSKSDDKELKAVTPEKNKSCVTAFTKKLVTIIRYQEPKVVIFSLNKPKKDMLHASKYPIWLVVTWSADFESRLMPRSA